MALKISLPFRALLIYLRLMAKKQKKVNWEKLRQFLKQNPELERELVGKEEMHHGRAKKEFKDALREVR